MTKYHIKSDGTPGVCRANAGNCPLSSDSEHFDSVESAQKFADEKMGEKFGYINKSESSNVNLTKKEDPIKRENLKPMKLKGLLSRERKLAEAKSALDDSLAILKGSELYFENGGLTYSEKSQKEQYQKALKEYDEKFNEIANQRSDTKIELNAALKKAKRPLAFLTKRRNEIAVGYLENKMRDINNNFSEHIKTEPTKEEEEESSSSSERVTQLINLEIERLTALNNKKKSGDSMDPAPYVDELSIARGRVTRKKKQLKRAEDELNKFTSENNIE